MESLIYDRTLSDITNLTSKALFNASFLNRVESWTKHLNDKFNELGYSTGDKPIINLFNTKNVSMTYSGLTIDMSGNTLLLTGNCTGNTGKRTIASELNIPKGDYIVKLIGESKGTFEIYNEEETMIAWGASNKTYKITNQSVSKIMYYTAITGTYNYTVKFQISPPDRSEFMPGYKERPITVDYIESTGTQYIDTGITPNQDTTIEMAMSFNSLTGTECLWCARDDYVSNTFSSYRENGVWRTDYSNTSNPFSSVSLEINKKYVLKQDKNSTYIDGQLLKTVTKTNFTSPSTLTLFVSWKHNHSSDIGYYSKTKTYYCKIYDNGILVRDFIPAIDPNGIVCLYDKVTNTYFYNQGTGNFKVGYKELANPVYEVKDFVDTSLFNLNQNSTRTLINEQTPISNSFIRLSNTQWEYPASGFTLSNKPELQFDGNVVAAIMYKYTVDSTTRPRVGWASNADGSSLWNCTASNYNSAWMDKGDDWTIKRVKFPRDKYNTYRVSGCFGFCQRFNSDNIVLDIAGISFYNLTDEQYADTDYINSLGVAGFGAKPKAWEYKDDFVLAEADRIINNINVLRSIIALYNDTPATPETMRFLDYIKANDIEKILFDIDKLVNNMVANFRYSNDLISGEGYYS